MNSAALVTLGSKQTFIDRPKATKREGVLGREVVPLDPQHKGPNRFSRACTYSLPRQSVPPPNPHPTTTAGIWPHTQFVHCLRPWLAALVPSGHDLFNCEAFSLQHLQHAR